MALIFTQTDTLITPTYSTQCRTATDGDAKVTIKRDATNGGTAGSTTETVTITKTDLIEDAIFFGTGAINATSWPGSTGNEITFRLDIKGTNANLNITNIVACRMNSSGVSQATYGTWSGTRAIGTVQVETFTLTTTAQGTTNTTDWILFIVEVDNTDTGHSDQSFTFAPSQNIDTAITEASGGVDITVPQANLSFSTTAPSIEVTQDVAITVPQGNLTLSTSAPQVATDGVIIATTATTLPGASDTNWQITTTKLKGLVPKAAICYLTGATTDNPSQGSPDLDWMGCIGFAAGSNAGHITWQSQDDVTTSANTGDISGPDFFECKSPSDVADSKGVLVNFIQNGIEINYTYTSMSGQRLVVVFFAGNDVSAEYLQYSLTGTSAQEKNFASSVQPDLLFLASRHRSTWDGANAVAIGHVGVVTGSDGTIESQQAFSWRLDENSNQPCNSFLDTSDCGIQQENGSQSYYVNCTSLDADGFTLTPSADPAGDQFMALGIEFTNADVWSDVLSSETATGNKAYNNTGGNGPAFKPQFVGFIPTFADSIDTLENATPQVHSTGMAFSDATDQYSNTGFSEDQTGANSNTGNYYQATMLRIPRSDGSESNSTSVRTSLVSFDNEGWTMNYNAVDSTARYFIAFAVEEWNPPVSNDVAVTIPQANLSLSTSAPTVAATAHADITVPQANLSLSTVAPAAAITEDVPISVPQGNLSLSTEAPSISVTEDVPISVPQGNLSLSTEAPSISITAHVPVTIPQGDLTLSTEAPVISVTEHVPVTVPQGDLSLSTQAPTVTATDSNNIVVPQGDLSLSTTAPSVTATAHVDITVPQGNLTLTTAAPSLGAEASVSITVPQGNLLIGGDVIEDGEDLIFTPPAPTITVTEDVPITVPQGDLSLTPTAPTVTATAHRDIEVPQGNLTLSTQAPGVSLGDNVDVTIPQSNLTLTTEAPTVSVTEDVPVTIPQANLTLTTAAPVIDVTQDVQITVPNGDLVITSLAPGVTVSENVVITVPQADLVLTSEAPGVTVLGDVDITVPQGNLSLSTTAPVIDITGVVTSTGTSGGGRGRLIAPWLPERKKPKKKEVVEQIERVVRKRVEHQPVDFDSDKIERIALKIEEILQNIHNLAEIDYMAHVALEVERGKAIPYEEIEVLRDVNEDFIPVVDEVIEEQSKPPYDRKYDDIVAKLISDENERANQRRLELLRQIDSTLEGMAKKRRLNRELTRIVRKRTG